MPLESLSFECTIALPEVPDRWLPLLHVYDPDLPLFPIYYFHALRPGLAPGARPLATDRVFGYVERIIPAQAGHGISVRVITNKDVTQPANAGFRSALEDEVRHRFGVVDPVRLEDVSSAFLAPLDYANPVLAEMWHRVVANAYGNLLPFGRLWDEVFGLARFVASWNSQNGRKGELIQTHYFAKSFGVRIGAGADKPQLDFFLLPTLAEILDSNNPLTEFPAFRSLLRVSECIATTYGTPRTIGTVSLTAFKRPGTGQFNTDRLLEIINGAAIPHDLRGTALECFNAFGKGPARTILFLLMLHDLRRGLLRPSTLISGQFGSIYDGLSASYQSPKVIAIYAQQCFGNHDGMPVDIWIETFLMWPLSVYPTHRTKTPLTEIFTHGHKLGKMERLLWVTSQARKVHSSACNDALWCIKYGAADSEEGGARGPRGANPFSCNICSDQIRKVCPAYDVIRDQLVSFNQEHAGAHFRVNTSAGSNHTPNQSFVQCTGKGRYGNVTDEFSPADVPAGFNSFPASHHGGEPITVAQFVEAY